MPRTYDEAWVEKQLHDSPPKGYKLQMFEFFAFLDYKNDITYAMTACYNYGFQRGRKFERTRAAKKRLRRD